MSDTNNEREQQLFDGWFWKRYGRKPDMHGNDGDCGRWSAWLGRAHLKQEPALLLQDENSGREGRRYNEWHASRPDARMNAREAAAALTPHPETPALPEPSAQVQGEKAQMRQALEHCLNWLPEDCAAACEARAVLALAPGLSGWQEDAMRYREVLKSGIPYSKDRDFSDAETDEIVDKRIADRLAAIPEGIAPHQPNKGNGAPPVFAHRNGVKTHERKAEDSNRSACRQGDESEGAASSNATGTSGAELGAGSRGDEDGRLVTSGLHSEQVQAAPHQPQPEPTSKVEAANAKGFVTIPVQWFNELFALCGPEQHELIARIKDSAVLVAAGNSEAAELKVLASQQRETQEAAEVTEFNVGRYCLSEDDCIAEGLHFGAYERGVEDAAKAFGRNRRG